MVGLPESRSPEGSPLAPNPLLRLRAYDHARQVVDEGWLDVLTMGRHWATRLVAGQLLRTLGSITANIAEGYSRSTGPDRARFFEYAAGSAREGGEWYWTGRRVIGSTRAEERIAHLDVVTGLLVGLTRRTRGRGYRADDGE